MTLTPTNLGVPLVVCLPFGRSTRWNVKCARTSNGKSTSNLAHFLPHRRVPSLTRNRVRATSLPPSLPLARVPLLPPHRRLLSSPQTSHRGGRQPHTLCPRTLPSFRHLWYSTLALDPIPTSSADPNAVGGKMPMCCRCRSLAGIPPPNPSRMVP